MMHLVLLALAFQARTAGAALAPADYCTPEDSCWPAAAEWQALKESVGGRLHALDTSAVVTECLTAGKDGTMAADMAHGACMPNRGCWKEHCDEEKSWQIPSYSLAAESVSDIKLAIKFANKHKVAVSIKSTGHGYAGSAIMYGTLLIWTYSLPDYLEVAALTDSCGTTFDETLKVGGGTPWGAIFKKIKTTHDIVSGGSVNVGGAGGWLAGGGLAAMSRYRGLGVDNVLRYKVVTASAEEVTVDACSDPDLFWALRGGGGGAFGVVTAIWYRIWPKTEVVELMVYHNGGRTTASLTQWINFFVDELQPTKLDNRWGGYWSPTCHAHATGVCLNFKFWGSMEDAKATLLDKLEQFAASSSLITVSATPKASFVEGQYDDGTACGLFRDCSAPTACEKFGAPLATEGNIPFWNRPTSWMLPVEFLENKDFAKSVLVEAISVKGDLYCDAGHDAPGGMPTDCFYDFGGLYAGYILGGAVNDVDSNATSVNPIYRRAGANILSLREPAVSGGMAVIRSKVNSTPCFNHDGYPDLLGTGTPDDWQQGYWGDQLAALTKVKERVDPDRRFNCYQCIGYSRIDPTSKAVIVGYEDPPNWEAPCPMSPGWALVIAGSTVGGLLLLVGLVVFFIRRNRKRQVQTLK